MLGIVTTFRNKVQATLQTLSAMVSTIKARYLKPGVLTTQATLYAAIITNLFVQTKQNIKRLVALCISQVPSIKVGLIHVLHKVGQLGQQLLTIAHQSLQRVLVLLKRGK